MHFACLSTLDRTMLDTSKVLLFLKVVESVQDKEGSLLENEDGLTTD